MLIMTAAPVPIKELRISDASYYICGFSSEQRLDTASPKFRDLFLFLLPDTMWILAQRPNFPDQLISPFYVKHLTLKDAFDEYTKLVEEAKEPPPPDSPSMVAAKKKVAEKKARIEAEKAKATKQGSQV